MIFHYSVRRHFSQGTKNLALEQPQTYPLASIFGNGGVPHGQLNRMEPGLVVTQGNQLVGGFGGQIYSGPNLGGLVSQGGIG